MISAACEACGFNLDAQGICQECGLDAYSDLIDDAPIYALCIFCGAIVAWPEKRHNEDGTIDHACENCAFEYGWIVDETEADHD